MSSASFFRAAATLASATTPVVRARYICRASLNAGNLRRAQPAFVSTGFRSFATTPRRWADHQEETFEEFNTR
jgi:hypothetical protein